MRIASARNAAMPTWDATRYLRFENERTRPCIDLVTQIKHDDVHIAADLGCGPGNSTAVLAQRFPTATVTGYDNSQNMLDRAGVDHPDLRFAHADIATWRAETPCDVILANASLHWLPDHAALFVRLMSMLEFGGVLAVQMPDNFHEPSHTLMDTAADAFPVIRKPHKPAVHEPAFYYDVLAPLTSNVGLWRTQYTHVMPDHAAIVNWTRGTGLRPYLDQLAPDQHDAFLNEYHRLIAHAYPAQRDGRVLFPFRRLFILAVAR
jgi:trans-aconitate 2-methyltransferase